MEPHQAARGGPGTAPHPAEAAARRSGIPAPVTVLIGRLRESEGIAAALDSSRLVTLMGPGGVGKTRLALDVAARVQSRFGGRAWWVELAPVARDDMAAQAIADAVGARDASGLDLVESIAARIAEHPALIVLDNCEHLTAGCREVADRLLATCPRLHILATSREPDRTSTRLNSSHVSSSYAVFCSKKKNIYHEGLLLSGDKTNSTKYRDIVLCR